MKKDAYYFPHFSNARNDQKVLKLRRVLGLEGYAIYFMLLEILREQTDWSFPLDGLAELEFELRASKEKISTVIHDYDLFEVNTVNNFFSPKLVQYLQPYIEKSMKARESARIRWDNANALQAHNERNTSKGKETKENKTKVKQTEPLEIPSGFGERFLSSWNDWLSYRKERKLTCTPRTLKMQLSLLGARGEAEAIAVINQSIQNGWQGLFELKTNQNGKKQIDVRSELGDIYNK